MTGAPLDPSERGRLDSLIAMANTVADTPDRGLQPVDHALPWSLLVVAVASLIIGGLAGYVLGKQQADDSSASPTTVARPVEFSVAELLTIPPATIVDSGEQFSTTVAAETTTTATDSTTTVATSIAPTTTVPSGPTTTGPTPPFAAFFARQLAGKSNFAVFDGQSLVLSGKMASAPMIDDWVGHLDAAFDLPIVDNLDVDAEAGGAVGFVAFPGVCYFESASTSIDATCQAVLADIAAAIIADPGAQISVSGNSDSDSTLERIAELSEMRANSARDILVINGVPVDRIVVLPRGANDPAGDNATPEGRALNRRIDIMIDEMRP